jgi:hypothetical protein
MNRPYKKQYDKNGILLNPITKEKPYLHAPRVSALKEFKRKAAIKLRFWERVRNTYFIGNNVTT